MTDEDKKLLLFTVRSMECTQKAMAERIELIYLMMADTTLRLDDFLDAAEIKEKLHISDSTLYRLKKSYGLKAFTLGGKEYFLEREVVEALLNSRSGKMKPRN